MWLVREREQYHAGGVSSYFGANFHICAPVMRTGSCLRWGSGCLEPSDRVRVPRNMGFSQGPCQIPWSVGPLKVPALQPPSHEGVGIPLPALPGGRARRRRDRCSLLPCKCTFPVPTPPQGSAASFSKTSTAKLDSELLLFPHFAWKSFSSILALSAHHRAELAGEAVDSPSAEHRGHSTAGGRTLRWAQIPAAPSACHAVL